MLDNVMNDVRNKVIDDVMRIFRYEWYSTFSKYKTSEHFFFFSFFFVQRLVF